MPTLSIGSSTHCPRRPAAVRDWRYHPLPQVTRWLTGLRIRLSIGAARVAVRLSASVLGALDQQSGERCDDPPGNRCDDQLGASRRAAHAEPLPPVGGDAGGNGGAHARPSPWDPEGVPRATVPTAALRGLDGVRVIDATRHARDTSASVRARRPREAVVLPFRAARPT